MRIRLFLSCLALFAVDVSAHAQQQEVAFLGDNLTVLWGEQPQFEAHRNWIDYGVPVTGVGGTYWGTNTALPVLQSIIASGKRPIIHLMVGESNSESASPGNQPSVLFGLWADGFEKIITTAQAAKLPVIVGTIPYSLVNEITVTAMNKWIFVYCAAHNIPVVNYDFALNSGTGFAAGPVTPTYYVGPTNPTSVLPNFTLTKQGWDLITDMAETGIALASGVKLTGGYLQTVVHVINDDDQTYINGNTVPDTGIVQFTPWGEYSDGSTHIMNNADINGHIGVFTSANPLALVIDQNGVGTGMDAGTANIHFTTNSGAMLNEWIMTTYIGDEACYVGNGCIAPY
jgi:hypothetical protein